MNNVLNIGWISAAAYATTGYGRMCKEILPRLISNGYNITNIGGIGGTTVWGGKMNYPVEYMDKGVGKFVEIPVVPTIGHIAGKDIMDMFLDKYKFNLLITHWDAFAIDWANELPVPCINYLPIDAQFTKKMYDMVKKAHKIVAFSKYGYNELFKHFSTNQIDYIPHGINTDEWKPSSTKERNIFRENTLGLKRDDFLIFVNGANVGERKMLPLILQVFKKFAKQHQDAKLYMFTSSNVQYPRGYDLIAYLTELGLKDNVYFPRYDPMIESFTNEELRKLYSAADVFLTASIGEGFGVPMLEAQACGTPVIAPDNSTVPELVGDHGLVYDSIPNFEFTPVWIPTLQSYPLPSMESMFEKLEFAYKHHNYMKVLGDESRDFSLRYDWHEIMTLWFNLLEKSEYYVNYKI